MFVIVSLMSLVRRLGDRVEQRRRRHHHARLAVAALRHVEMQPGLLDRVRAVRRQALDGGDGLALDEADGRTQERTAWPSTCTVQAPHWAMPQPYLVPVRPSCSRITHRSGVSSSTSTSRALPLIVKRAIAVFSRFGRAAAVSERRREVKGRRAQGALPAHHVRATGREREASRRRRLGVGPPV
jgi:hypothetical protein